MSDDSNETTNTDTAMGAALLRSAVQRGPGGAASGMARAT